MTDDDAFIRAILSDPEDTTTRLVYADWLDDQDDPRGQYLRLLSEAEARHRADPARVEALRRAEVIGEAHAEPYAPWFENFVRPWLQRLALSRVRRLIALTCRRKEDPVEGPDDPRWTDLAGPNWWAAKFTPQSPMTEAEVADWETRMGVRVPAEYRLFLTEIGRNAGMPETNWTHHLIVWAPDEVYGFRPEQLAEPFPVPARTLRARLAAVPPRHRTAPGWRSPFTEVGPLRRHPPDNPYGFGPITPPGLIMVINQPVTLHPEPAGRGARYLVVTGELAGMVWNNYGWGWMPELDPGGEPMGFLRWIEHALLRARWRRGSGV